ncbi:hypothetical protein BH10PAT3_BH10PAT3_1580 [soil metagenome]
MKSTLGKIWIDMTDMSFWSGHLTGTQRVVYEVSKRFHELEPRSAFFVYNDKNLEFYEISFSDIAANIEREEVAAATAVPVEVGSTSLGKVKHLAIRSYQALPYSVRSKIKTEHKTNAKKVFHYAKEFRSRVHRRRYSLARTAAKSTTPLRFDSNDNVLLLGKPWDTMSFIETLRRQKVDTGFEVSHLVYDFTPTFLPHVFGKPLPANYTQYMFEACSLSETLIAISESTKRDIQKFCELELIPKPRVTTARLGDYVSLPSSDKNAAIKSLADTDFIVCVGTIEIRKNHTLIYTAYKEGICRGIKLPHLVIVGSVGWYTGDILYELANDPEIKDLVTVLSHTSDAQLAWLYRNCRYAVYASVYEGWGLPIAEALNYGKLCIASDSSSMQEIAGNLIEYFSPYDSVACLTLIAKYLDDKILRSKEKEIAEKYIPIGWDRTYEDVRTVL